MYKVTFKFENSEDVTVFAAFGESLLEVARKTNVAIDAPCSGNASCGKCRVKLVEGELDSKQTRHISDEEYAQGWRLACCSKINADVAVMVPDIASAYRSRMKVADLSSPDEVKIFDNIKQSITEAGIELKNNLESIHVKMDVPTLDDTMPDNERLTRAIREITGMQRVKLPYSVIHKMAQVLREHNFDVNVVIRKTEKDIFVYDICGADETPVIAGLAIDIGTTTVSAIIIDMTDGKILAKGSSGNGQIRYGADVINRIIESRKPGGQDKLQKAIIEETINPLVQTMCRQAKINPMNIYRMSVAANTTMNHLLIGVNADPVRMEPYIPTFFKTNSIFAGDIGIKVNPDAHIILAPNIGSYVGGDITAGAFVTMLWNQEPFSLFIDLGTNGEIVFGNSDFMFSCACSAGPAFEGGDISCGMRATDGAIEACTIDAETMGSYVLAFEGEEAGSSKDVEITEVDIDSFIRAKGAIFSAIRTMLSYCDFDISMIENVYVAGGIGSGINMANAINIGMFPDIPVEMYHYVGNTSLAGAYAMLCSTESERKVYDLAANMTYIELSTIPQYMDEFVGACFLPHTDASLFPNR